MQASSLKNKRLLLTGFSLSIVILVISSTAAFVSVRKLLYSQALVQHSSNVGDNLAQLYSGLLDLETYQRGYLLTGNEKFSENYTAAIDSAYAGLSMAGWMTEDNEGQQLLFNRLEGLVKRKVRVVTEGIGVRESTNQASLSLLEEGKLAMDSIRLLIGQMVEKENKMLADRNHEYQRFAGYTPKLLIASGVLSIVITGWFYRRLRSNYYSIVYLEKSLLERERQMALRIEAVSEMAYSIASGNYEARISIDKDD